MTGTGRVFWRCVSRALRALRYLTPTEFGKSLIRRVEQEIDREQEKLLHLEDN